MAFSEYKTGQKVVLGLALGWAAILVVGWAVACVQARREPREVDIELQ
jgi:hypothetical protein